MAITIDQANCGEAAIIASATLSLVTSQTVAAGAVLIVFLDWRDGTARSLTSISGGGLTWQNDLNPGVQNEGGAVMSAACPAGLATSTTLTITLSGTAEIMAFATSVNGLVTTAARVDGTPLSEGATEATIWTCPAFTTTVAETILFGFSSTSAVGSPSSTPTSPWIEAHDNNITALGGGGAQNSATLVYQILAAAGANTPTGTWSTNQTGADQDRLSIAFKAGGPPQNPSTPVRFVYLRRNR